MKHCICLSGSFLRLICFAEEVSCSLNLHSSSYSAPGAKDACGVLAKRCSQSCPAPLKNPLLTSRRISKTTTTWRQICGGKAQLSVGIANLLRIHEQLKTLCQASLASVPFCQWAHHLRMLGDESWVDLAGSTANLVLLLFLQLQGSGD